MTNAIATDTRATRDRLLAAAIEVFAEKGYRARVQDITRRAGFTAGALYVYFPGRIELVEEAILSEAARLVAEIDPTDGYASFTPAQAALVLEAVAIAARSPQPSPFTAAVRNLADSNLSIAYSALGSLAYHSLPR